jgi:curved DNA-binding protein CbpA
MGNIGSSLPETHIRIYKNIFAIQSPHVRSQMIETLLNSPEHVLSMKQAGIYGQLIYYIQQIKAGKSAVLPGEKTTTTITATARSSGSTMLTNKQGASEKGNERAMNYFSACLRILDLEEEVALTPEGLKSAYKKAVLRAHPDKGGSEKEFEAVTRAYAYLGEILQRIHGGRAAEGKVEAPSALSSTRTQAADKWKMVEPVRLNPDKLDLQTFNTMFDQTRIPDPDDTGYGDWLKGEESASKESVKFGGKFNRDVFHKAFEEEQRSKNIQGGGAIVAQELSMASRMGYGVELGRSTKEDFTVSANDTGLKFTDLKKAYTDYTTFSQNTAGMQIQSKNLEQYTMERKNAPTVFNDREKEALYAAEKAQLQAEERRKLRVAQESVEENSYFDRMKRLVIRN